MIPDLPAPLGLAPALMASPPLRAIFSARGTIQAALDVEAALARAAAAAGLCTPEAAQAVTDAAKADLHDIQAIVEGTARAGTLAIPLVKHLRAEATKRLESAGDAVHPGATSQDIADTALVLQLRAALAALRPDAEALRAALARLAREHRDTVLTGRTLLQPGPPVTLGLKIAGWLGALARGLARLDASAKDALVLQYGGAVGTLASLGADGPRLAAGLAAELDLPLPEAPWHTQRDRLVAFASDAAILTGSLAKMARDVALLMQVEVAEVAEPGGAGRGGSSTMPHKRNPIASTAAMAAAHRVPGLLASVLAGMPQEHERAVGGWQAEAQPIAEIVLALSACLVAMREVAEGMRVDAARMRANWDALQGLPLAERLAAALARSMGRGPANAFAETLSQRAVADRTSLSDAARASPEVIAAIPAEDLATLFEPEGYLGAAGDFTDALLAAYGADG